MYVRMCVSWSVSLPPALPVPDNTALIIGVVVAVVALIILAILAAFAMILVHWKHKGTSESRGGGIHHIHPYKFVY